MYCHHTLYNLLEYGENPSKGSLDLPRNEECREVLDGSATLFHEPHPNPRSSP